MNRRNLAREGLYAIVGLGIGFLWPLVILPIVGHEAPVDLVGDLADSLFRHDTAGLAWLVVLAPYLVFQLGRSVVWAAKVVRSRSRAGATGGSGSTDQ